MVTSCFKWISVKLIQRIESIVKDEKISDKLIFIGYSPSNVERKIHKVIYGQWQLVFVSQLFVVRTRNFMNERQIICLIVIRYAKNWTYECKIIYKRTISTRIGEKKNHYNFYEWTLFTLQTKNLGVNKMYKCYRVKCCNGWEEIVQIIHIQLNGKKNKLYFLCISIIIMISS